MFESITKFTEEVIVSYGLLGIFTVAVLESFIFPIPTAIIITTGTALKLDPLIVVVVATIGSVLGAIIGYKIGERGGRPVLVWLFDEKKISRVDRLFERYGVYAVGVAAFSPLPFKIFTISAGVARMSIIPFILVSIPCRFLQFLLFALFGNWLSGFL
ncbi:MAG: DedA family protein [Candidatus Altiarchaeales archaeon]|nr:MAG: DedA family protein [Candidatus Altiarchaeales archaeon]HDI73343.1 DedA family protein [Candidatus Altiarchaeales archaeon]